MGVEVQHCEAEHSRGVHAVAVAQKEGLGGGGGEGRESRRGGADGSVGCAMRGRCVAKLVTSRQASAVAVKHRNEAQGQEQ